MSTLAKVAFGMSAVGPDPMSLASVGEQRTDGRVGFDHHRTAVTSRTAGRLAAWLALATEKRRDSGTTAAALDADTGSIDEVHTRTPAVTRRVSARYELVARRAPSVGSEHTHVPAPTAAAVLNNSIDLRKERVVASAAHVLTGMDAGAALAHDDRPCGHHLPVEHLRTEALSR